MSLVINGEFIDDEVIEEEFQHCYQQHPKKNLLTNITKKDLLQKVKEKIVLKILLKQEIEKKKIEISKQKLDREVIWFKKWNEGTAQLSQEEIEKYVLFKLKEEKLTQRLMEEVKSPKDFHLKEFFIDNQEDYVMKNKYTIYAVSIKDKTKKLKQINNLERFRVELIEKGMEYFDNPKNTNFTYLKIKGYEEELTREGSKLLEEMEKNKSSKILYKTISIFKPFQFSQFSQLDKKFLSSKSSNMGKQTLFYYLSKVEKNYLPPFEEIKYLIKKDLQLEIEKITIDIFLQKILKKSKIVDNVYLDSLDRF